MNTQARFIMVGALMAVANVACAQRPGQRLSVQMPVSGITVRGDTTVISYRVVNAASSHERVATIQVPAPTGVGPLQHPGIAEEWFVMRGYRGRRVAQWVVLGEQLAPGRSVDSLSHGGIGVLGVVTARIRGHYPPLPVPTDAEVTADPALADTADPMISHAVSVQVVGIVPPPVGGIDGLVALIGSNLQDFCSIDIDNQQGLCRSLQAKLNAAQASLRRGNRQAAQGQVGALLNELEGVGDRVVADTYWLLRGNAEILRNALL